MSRLLLFPSKGSLYSGKCVNLRYLFGIDDAIIASVAGSVGSSLLGGSKSQQSSTGFLPVQADWVKNLLEMYGPTAGQGANVYQGQRVAPLTSDQLAAADIGGWASYLNPAAQIPMYGQTGTALSGLLSGQTGAEEYTPETVNTLFKSAYETPARQEWQDFTRPAIKEAYSGPGYWSSNRMEAERRGAQDLSNWLGSQYGQLTYATDQANKALQEAKAGRALSAIPLGLEYGQQPLNQTLNTIAGRQQLFNLASVPQQQQQAEINAAIQKFAEENQLTDPQNLNVLLSLLGMGMSQSQSTQSGGNPLANAFSGQVGANWANSLFPTS